MPDNRSSTRKRKAPHSPEVPLARLTKSNNTTAATEVVSDTNDDVQKEVDDSGSESNDVEGWFPEQYLKYNVQNILTLILVIACVKKIRCRSRKGQSGSTLNGRTTMEKWNYLASTVERSGATPRKNLGNKVQALVIKEDISITIIRNRCLVIPPWDQWMPLSLKHLMLKRN
jgi:hypothetical protein